MDLKEILEYQKIDMQIRKIEADVKNSDDKKKAEQMQAYWKNGQSKLAALEETSAKLVKLHEKAVQTYNDFVAKLDAMIKEGEPKNQSEATAQMEKLNSYHAACVKIQKDLESLKNSLEKIAADCDAVRKNMNTAKGNFEVYKKRLSELKQNVEPELNALKEQRAKLEPKIDPELLAKYKHKAESKPKVIVECKDNTCGGCRMEISGAKIKSLREKGIIECENCGRIITASF